MKAVAIAVLVLGITMILLLGNENAPRNCNEETIYLTKYTSPVHKQYAEQYGKV
jgi:hypothetical protein